jgi:hypothetical protein
MRNKTRKAVLFQHVTRMGEVVQNHNDMEFKRLWCRYFGTSTPHGTLISRKKTLGSGCMHTMHFLLALTTLKVIADLLSAANAVLRVRREK